MGSPISSDIIPIDYNYRSEDSISGYTLYSGTLSYRFENGRTYHIYREGEYWGPNDDKMLAHEAIVHELCSRTLRTRHYLAPITNPRRILDIGTGRGLWAIAMGDLFPDAEVLGIDLSVQPRDMVPSNVTFETDDATSEWTDPKDHYDFIHIRGLFGSIADWPALYAQIFDHLAPGGHFEQVEFSVRLKSDDDSLPPNSALAQWSTAAITFGERIGKTTEIAETMAPLIREAGFSNIRERRYKWPIGAWSTDPALKDMGRWNIRNWEEGMEGWGMSLYTKEFGWTKQQVDEWVDVVKSELRNRRQHVYHEVRVVYCQKPH